MFSVVAVWIIQSFSPSTSVKEQFDTAIVIVIASILISVSIMQYFMSSEH